MSAGAFIEYLKGQNRIVSVRRGTLRWLKRQSRRYMRRLGKRYLDNAPIKLRMHGYLA